MQPLTLQRSKPFYRNHLIRDAIGQAIDERMGEDSSIHLFGEGCEVKVHYDHPDIERDFTDRIHTLPISEDGNMNFAVGASLLGIKPIVDVITSDFLYRCMDSICNTAAKLDFAEPTHRQASTIVIRSEFFAAGPTTGQRIESLFVSLPGLRVVIPSTPRDAYGLMLTALTEPGVTLFFEDRMIHDEGVSAGDQRLNGPIGWHAFERRNGTATPDVTVVTYGLMRQVTEEALDPMLNIDLIDLRCIYPIDWLEIKTSVRRSKRLLIIEPDIKYGGVGAEIAATIAEEMPGVRIKRLGAPRLTLPANPALHPQMMPSKEEIVGAVTTRNW